MKIRVTANMFDVQRNRGKNRTTKEQTELIRTHKDLEIFVKIFHFTIRTLH